MDNLTPCPKCQSLRIVVLFQVSGPHYARVMCQDTNCRWSDWLSKPDSDKIRRPASHRELVRKYGLKHCEWCGIRETDLPKGEVIEANHVHHYDEGGSSDRANIVAMCTACHKLWHWRQTWSRVPQMANPEQEGD